MVGQEHPVCFCVAKRGGFAAQMQLSRPQIAPSEGKELRGCAGRGPELAHHQRSSMSHRVWIAHCLMIKLIERVQRRTWCLGGGGKMGVQGAKGDTGHFHPKTWSGWSPAPEDGDCRMGPGMGPAGSPQVRAGVGGHVGWVLEDHPGEDLEHSLG